MDKNKQNPNYITITEAAKCNNVTRQAIYVAIKLKKLPATKEGSKWTINLKDLETYKANKYSRTKSTHNGELLYDNAKGWYSVNQVAEMLEIPAQKIYYGIRAEHIKAERRGAAWVINIDNVKEYREAYLDKADIKKAQ